MTELQQAFDGLLGAGWSVSGDQAVGGGCISDARRVSATDEAGRGHVLFVKSNEASFEDNFRAEWDGLVRLAEPQVIGVPKPIASGRAGSQAWLITTWVEQGARRHDFFQRFGRDLARLHQATLGEQIGLDRDNFLGSARQINAPRESWNEFVATQRIGFQMRWAVDQGLVDASLRRDCERIVETMDDLLDGREDRTCLLHGDLWSGNYLCDREGQPVIIDPAIYFGCREAEFGMLQLFGSCPASFYDSYQATFPLPAGWQRRVSVYVLYHLLNHLNLFGSGYRSQCDRIAADILGQ